MAETQKIAAILVADIVGYSRLAGADEDRTLARLRALRSDLIDPTIAAVRSRSTRRKATVGWQSFWRRIRTASSKRPTVAKSIFTAMGPTAD